MGRRGEILSPTRPLARSPARLLRSRSSSRFRIPGQASRPNTCRTCSTAFSASIADAAAPRAAPALACRSPKASCRHMAAGCLSPAQWGKAAPSPSFYPAPQRNTELADASPAITYGSNKAKTKDERSELSSLVFCSDACCDDGESEPQCAASWRHNGARCGPGRTPSRTRARLRTGQPGRATSDE